MKHSCPEQQRTAGLAGDRAGALGGPTGLWGDPRGTGGLAVSAWEEPWQRCKGREHAGPCGYMGASPSPYPIPSLLQRTWASILKDFQN